MNHYIYPAIASNDRQKYLIEKGVLRNQRLTNKAILVMAAIEKVTGVTPAEIRGRARYRPICDARKIYFFIMNENKQFTLVQIGKSIDKDHATVIHAVKASINYYDTDVEYKYKVDEIKRELAVSLS